MQAIKREKKNKNKKQKRMSQLNNSLIGYLKKKSLFSESPTKHLLAKDRSKSKGTLPKDGLSPRLRISSRQSQNGVYQDSSFKNYRDREDSQKGYGSVYADRASRFQGALLQEHNTSNMRRNFNPPRATPQLQPHSPNIWTNLVSHTGTFQSSRLQSSQCLQTMSNNLHNQLSTLSHKLDNFHTKLQQSLQQSLHSFKQRVHQLVDRIFQESEQALRVHIRDQEDSMVGELTKARDRLVKEYQKVQAMRAGISGENWRKVAGELLATDLEEKVESEIRAARGIDVGKWEVGDLWDDKIQELENLLREMVRLTAS